MSYHFSLWHPRKPGQAISVKSYLNLSEIRHVLLLKERPEAQSGRDEHPAVSTQCQAHKQRAVTTPVPLHQ